MGKKYSATDKQSTLNVAAEAIQIKIEQEIARRGNAAWLREIIASFVATQDKWNMNSEDRDTDHLQGGALLYVNSDLTEWANSDYRLLTAHRLTKTVKQITTKQTAQVVMTSCLQTTLITQTQLFKQNN